MTPDVHWIMTIAALVGLISGVCGGILGFAKLYAAMDRRDLRLDHIEKDVKKVVDDQGSIARDVNQNIGLTQGLERLVGRLVSGGGRG